MKAKKTNSRPDAEKLIGSFRGAEASVRLHEINRTSETGPSPPKKFSWQ